MHSSKKPRIFYGWIIVASSFIIVAVLFGMRFSFPVLYVAILNDFGWTRADTAFIYSLNLLTYGATAPIAGILLDSETGKPIIDEKEEAGGKEKVVNDDEMKKKMSAFYDFINTLDLDDFDKRKS